MCGVLRTSTINRVLLGLSRLAAQANQRPRWPATRSISLPDTGDLRGCVSCRSCEGSHETQPKETAQVIHFEFFSGLSAECETFGGATARRRRVKARVRVPDSAQALK